MATVRSLDEIAQFKSSFKEFYEEINSGNVERFYPSDENKSTLAHAIDSTNLPWAEKWIKPLWHWAYSSNLSKLEARPSEAPPEKKEENRQYINGKFNHAWKPDVVENLNPKNPALEFLNDLRAALNKPPAPKGEEDTPFRVHARGLPDASLPDNSPEVQGFLKKMKADSSPESLKSLKTYLQSRASYKMTHQEYEQ